MAFPAEQTADRVTSTNAATTSHTVDLPTNISSGDLILITGSLDTATGGIMTVPSGWTELIDEAPMVALYRVADGSEGTSITVDTSESVDSSWVARRIIDQGTGIESAINPSDGSDTNNANPDPPSLSPSWGADDTLWVAAFGCRVVDRILNSYPTDYVEGDTAQTGNTRSASATRDRNASSEDPGTFELSSNTPWIAATIAIEPGVAAPSKPTIEVPGAQIAEKSLAVDKTAGDDSPTVDHTDGHIDTSDGFTPGSGNLVEENISTDDALDVDERWVTSGRTPATVEFVTIVDYSTADESDGGAAADDIKYRLAPSVDTGLTLSEHPTDPEHGAAWSVTDNTGTDPGGPYPRIIQHKLQGDPWSNATEEIVPAGTTSGSFLGYSPGDTIEARSVTYHADLFGATDPGDGRIRSNEGNAPTDTLTIAEEALNRILSGNFIEDQTLDDNVVKDFADGIFS